VQRGKTWAYSVYDDLSKRLYLIHPGESALRIEPVYASAEVHYTTVLDGRLCILLFDPTESTIALLKRVPEQRAFEVLPVTLCEGTSSVFLTNHDGQYLFLFNERVVGKREKPSYQLSLLYTESAGDRYEKVALVEGEASIQGFAARKAGDILYVLYLRREKLTLLSLALDELPRSP
jgi:hypothetical protein